MTDCFICGGALSQVSDADWTCEGCKRVLYQCEDGNWATRPTKVKLKKFPMPGDLYTDCIEVKDDNS